MNASKLIRLGRVLAALALLLLLERPANAQSSAVVGKQHKSLQTNATTVTDDTVQDGIWRFSIGISSGATGTIAFTYPAGSSQSLPFQSSSNSYGVALFYNTQTDLDAAYPDGNYGLTFNGQTSQVTLAGAAYPNIPLGTASAGSWGIGSLTVNPSQPLTLTTNFTTNFTAGHANITLTITGLGNNYSNVVKSPDLNQNQLSVTIPAGTFQDGATYMVKIDLDNIPTLNTTSVAGWTIASYFEQETSFRITSSAQAVFAPSISTQPQSQTVSSGSPVTFTVAATGTDPLSYQWYRNGVAVPSGGNQATYSIASASASFAGSYTVKVTNSLGSATSAPATLTVTSPPAFTLQPVPQVVVAGSTVAFNVAASGSPAPTYQWFFGNSPINGATSPLLVIPNASTPNLGTYSCVAINSVGTATSAGASLATTTTTNPGRLINLSVLSVVQGSLTMGFVIGGAGTTGSENLLIRATGPALAGPPFNVPGVMIDPTLTVVRQNGSVTIATNSGWGTPLANQTAVTSTDAAVGAFALTNPNSLDSALVTALPVVVGGYTATVAGASGDSGYALTEVYDATLSGTYTLTTPRLVNLSCLTRIAPGGTLTVGFVVGGSTAKTVLIRVSGPTLAAAPFGIPGTMTDPQLTVQPLSNANQTLVANAGWRGDPQISTVATNVGAFALVSPSSKDSAAVVTLAAGVPYTVQATSASGVGGLVLVEIYEVP